MFANLDEAMYHSLESPSPNIKDDASWTIDENSLLGGILVDTSSSSPAKDSIPRAPKAMRKLEESPIRADNKIASLKHSGGSKSSKSSTSSAKRRARRNDHYSPPRSPRLYPDTWDRWERIGPILSESNSTKIRPRRDRVSRRKEESRDVDEDEGRLRRPSSFPPIHELCIRTKHLRSPKSKTTKTTEESQSKLPVQIPKKKEMKECYNCGVIGHSFMDCLVQCGHCGKDGHKTIWCSEIRGDVDAMDIDRK